MFAIPSLKDLVDRSRQAFRAYLPGSDAWLWPNNIYASAKVLGGMVFEVFGFADYIQKQKFALTADSENLDLHGAEYGVPRRPAGPARGFVTVSISSGPLRVDAGAVFARSDAVQYVSTVSGFLTGGGSLDIEVVSQGDGKGMNAEGGTPLEIVSGVTPIGVSLAAVATSGINGGGDVEDDESFRARILFRKRYPPHGGAAADYVAWGESAAGVSRVFVERLWNGVGTVRVFVLMDTLYPNGIPPAGEIDRVASYIETVRPSGAMVTVAAPAPVPVNIQIANLSPDTTTVREAVLAELRDTFLRRSRASGLDTPHGGMPFLATPAVFSRSWIGQAISNAAGEDSHDLNLPAVDLVLSPGQIAVLGNVTFTAG